MAPCINLLGENINRNKKPLLSISKMVAIEVHADVKKNEVYARLTTIMQYKTI
jgi:hypothetical protein